MAKTEEEIDNEINGLLGLALIIFGLWILPIIAAIIKFKLENKEPKTIPIPISHIIEGAVQEINPIIAVIFSVCFIYFTIWVTYKSIRKSIYFKKKIGNKTGD